MGEEGGYKSIAVRADGSALPVPSGHTNEITTTKYTLLSWLPLSFMYQFRRVANVYFLIISIFMIIGTYFPWIFVSPLEPLSTIVTLIVVMLVTSLKEGSDDLARYRSDREENETLVTLAVYNKALGTWEEKTVHSKVVQPGDIVKLAGRCRIPVDMVLLMTNTFADGNSCYVETSNIDGETNLKVKSAPPRAFEIIQSVHGDDAVNCTSPPPELFDISKLEFEEANKSIYTFVGAAKFDTGGDDAAPLGADNLLLRSSVFSNTDWAYGVAVYTGQETKVQMNNSLPPAKMSNFEKYANKAVAGVFLAQTLMVLTAVISFYGMGFDKAQEKLPYVYPDGSTSGVLPFWLEQIIVFYILFNNFIPISLYVTMELTNLGQADMIRYDVDMYDDEIDKACVVKSGNLMQELGQISQIFSDKTGTLTRNEMKLMLTVVDGVTVDMVQGAERLPARLSNKGAGRDLFFSFLECLLLCHTVVRERGEGVERKTEKDLKKSYRAESPDELALILGTLPFQCDFLDRQSSAVSIVVDGSPKHFELLATNAFNADRKRMSVLVREVSADRYYLICKGADNIMLPLTTAWDTPETKVQALKSLEDMAKKGLRTLVVGRKELPKAQALGFVEKWKTAANSMTDREANLGAAAAEVEQGMELVGITAIEDRLQDQVPEVIADLATAGITLWMLTGDKEETAVNIAASCNLTLEGTQLHFLSKIEDTATYHEKLHSIYKLVFPEQELQYAYQEDVFQKANDKNKDAKFSAAVCAAQCLPTFAGKEVGSNRGAVALVMDGPSFRHFDDTSESAKFHLLAITKWCRSVVACRLTPSQKAQIVNFVKTESSPKILTLAIGDGANDVPMIQEADVGIGIFGKEGHQAANNSDFAIGQFKFLRTLMLVHGRACYVGLAKVCLYCLHKNMVITFTIFWYSYYAALSGASPYESFVYTGFNFALGLPIIFLGILDRDITRAFCLKNPQTYSTSRSNALLSPMNMLSWFMNGLGYAFMLGALNYLAFYDTFTDQFIFDMGTTVFTGLVLALQMKIVAMTHQWAFPQVIAMAVSVGAMFGYFVACSYFSSEYYEKVPEMYKTGVYWFLGLLTAPLFTSVLVDGMWFVAQYLFSPTDEMLMREVELSSVYAADDGKSIRAATSNLARCGSMVSSAKGQDDPGFTQEGQREGLSVVPAAMPSDTSQSNSEVVVAEQAAQSDADALIFTVGSKGSGSGRG